MESSRNYNSNSTRAYKEDKTQLHERLYKDHENKKRIREANIHLKPAYSRPTSRVASREKAIRTEMSNEKPKTKKQVRTYYTHHSLTFQRKKSITSLINFTQML